MSQLLNQYSYVVMALICLVLLFLVVWRRGFSRNRIILLGALVLLILILWLAVRPTQTRVGGVVQVASVVGKGVPVLLEFQSPYCLACIGVRPQVDQLEKDANGRLLVIRLNTQSATGRQLAAAFGVQFTPTFVYLDAAGRKKLVTVGVLDAKGIKSLLAHP